MPGSPENPEVLPRAALLGSASRARLETLLELRDEACYLGLQDLYKLCCEQINQRHSLLSHSRDVSGSTAVSIRSLHTVIEQGPLTQEVRSSRLSSDTARSEPQDVPHHSSLHRERSVSKIQEEHGVGPKSPPSGWI